MKKLKKPIKALLLPVAISFFLSGCLDQTKNFTCTYDGSQGGIKSLSIKAGQAILGSVTFKASCGKTGNTSTYGYLQEDCANSSKVLGDYLTLSFDEISGQAYTTNRVDANGGSMTIVTLSCKKAPN